MKKLIFLLSLFSSTIASAQQIENVDYFLEGKNIVITYDLVNCNTSDLYDISVVFVEQNQSRVTPLTLSGDVQKVSCGTKRIVWNVLKDREELTGKYQVSLDFKVARKYPIDIEWVQIPAGSFTMGSTSSEVDRNDDEKQHQVTLSAFKMSKNEITFAQYDAFCDATVRIKPSDNGWGRGTLPVINVSWEDATAFAKWMGCRLPTESEWEYACRAGSKTPFYTGNNLTTNQANYNGNYPYCNNQKGNYLKKTQLVGSYHSNAWGLNDMHGNVSEWCSDNYGTYPSSIQINPIGSSSGTYYVLRGGSWLDNAQKCRSAYRGDYLQWRKYDNEIQFDAFFGSSNVGFRLVVAH